MATQSFKNTVTVTRKSAKKFAEILHSNKKTLINPKPIAKDVSKTDLKKLFGK